MPPGAATAAHHHGRSEELYLVSAGDCAAIPPGTVHQLRNTGSEDLVVVCACSPPYSHEDTFLAE